MIFTAKELIEALNPIKYNLIYDLYHSLQIDSRKCTRGSIFFALRGNKSDGHQHIKSAFENGAFLVISEREIKNFPYLMVENTKKALLNFLAYYLKKFNFPKIAITGSIGKTTTKNFIAQLIGDSISTTPKNYNTEVSVPLILNSINDKTRFLLFEFGLQYKGDISLLASIVKPDISVITKISNVHLEFFKSEEEIVSEKMSILDYTTKFAILESGLKKYTNFDRVKFVDYDYDFIEPYVNASFDYNGDRKIVLRNIPSFFTPNLFSSLEVCKFLNIPFNKLNFNLHLPEKRFEIKYVNGFKIISDCYNSNPYSLTIALNYLKKFFKERKVIILGDMLELGQDKIKAHKELSLQLKDFDIVILYGELLKYANDGYNYFSDKKKAINFMLNNIKKGDLIFIKGSRGMKMEDFEEAIECK